MGRIIESRVVFTLNNWNRYYLIFNLDEGEDALKYARRHIALRTWKTIWLECKDMKGNMACVKIDEIASIAIEHQFPKID